MVVSKGTLASRSLVVSGIGKSIPHLGSDTPQIRCRRSHVMQFVRRADEMHGGVSRLAKVAAIAFPPIAPRRFACRIIDHCIRTRFDDVGNPRSEPITDTSSLPWPP